MTTWHDYDRQPTLIFGRALDDLRGKVLDPQRDVRLAGQTVRPTAYVPDTVLVRATDADAFGALDGIADALDWEPQREPEPDQRPWRSVKRITLSPEPGVASEAPDAWELLQNIRLREPKLAARASLNHILTLSPFTESSPFTHSSPFTESSPFTHSSPVAGYATPGRGGRQPVAYVGQPPRRRARLTRRRPVVALLDSGCGQHPWLDAVVTSNLSIDGLPIGLDVARGPEFLPDTVGPLDGGLDAYAGHGTFSAGLVHQAAPDADIYSWRILPAEGALVEADLIDALDDLAELVRRGREGAPGGLVIDVLSLSVGYYHELPDDPLFDSPLWGSLSRLLALGVVVVCAAGNDATARPRFPAAFGPWDGDGCPIDWDGPWAPLVSVGALNPNGRCDALFSNVGPWVRAHAPGAAVLSTMPVTFQGGLQAEAASQAFGRPRASIDPDDFTAGFGLWSGTSFAAPLMAGRLAAAMLDGRSLPTDPVDRGRAVVARVAGLVPQ